MNGKVYIIILNWNGWRDTIECLESVFRNTYKNYQVIVCDNNSRDHSLEQIKEWANGKILARNSVDAVISQFTDPVINKPIKYIEYNSHQTDNALSIEREIPLILIQTGGNLGFAGGNNVGIKYALAKDDFDYIWLLNNDTVIHSDALEKLFQHSKFHPDIGICGSKLIYYDNPKKIQALGGSYNKILGTTKHIIEEKNLTKLDFAVGASMLISKKFIQTIGLMNEEYFLYYEEIDWAVRARGKFQLGCAIDSIVYHKEGSTINGGLDKNSKSELSDYYSIRNRILISKKYFPRYLPIVYFGLLVTIFNRIRRKQYKRIKMIMEIIFNN